MGRPATGRPAIVLALVVGFTSAPRAATNTDARPADARPVANGRPPVTARPAPETFVVEPFVNGKGVKSLAYLEIGVPALIAERLGRHKPLRFVGGPGLFARVGTPVPTAARWIVGGSFERRADWQIGVTVRVQAVGDAGVFHEATRAGPKDDASKLALEAAFEAFGRVPKLNLAPATDPLLAPFSRDAYAFVLYGRGIATFLQHGAKGKGGDRAVEVLKRSVVIDPKVPEVRRYLGFVHLEAGRPGHARAQWTYALDVRPGYVIALAGLAALDRAAALPTARERYGELVALDPDDLEARRSYGELLSEAGRLDEAQAELEKVLRRAPGDLRARRALALVLAARRAGAELVAELQQLVKLDPEDVDARLDLAAAYLSIDKPNDAEEVYDEVLRRRPRNVAALKLVGDLARARGDLKKAAAAYGKLRWVAPQDPRPVFLLGAAQFEAGDLDAAERMFNEGARYPGMMGDAYSNLGAIALRRGQGKQALWFLKRAVKKRPGKANIRFNHAVALVDANRHADALNELHVAQAIEPSDAELKFFTGVVALRLGLLAEAEQSFREALRLDPKHERARHNLALLEPLVKPRGESSVSFTDAPVLPIENRR